MIITANVIIWNIITDPITKLGEKFIRMLKKTRTCQEFCVKFDLIL